MIKFLEARFFDALDDRLEEAELDEEAPEFTAAADWLATAFREEEGDDASEGDDDNEAEEVTSFASSAAIREGRSCSKRLLLVLLL